MGQADRSGDGMLSMEELEDFGDSSDENPFDPELMMEKADANGYIPTETGSSRSRRSMTTLPR